MRRSIFGRLAKWATRQGENFLTESFLVVIEELRENEPETFVRLLSWLTRDFLVVGPTEAGEVRVQSQTRHELGQPDVCIRFRNRQAIIEVKDESPFGERQLERYRLASRMQDDVETVLIALTRYVLGKESVAADTADRALRWVDVGEWLEMELESSSIQSPATQFLIRQFHQFLAEKGLAMQKIGQSISDGIQSLRNLAEMLEEALKRCGFSSAKVAIQLPYAIGTYLDGERFHVGIRFDEPTYLQFRTYRFRIDSDRARTLGIGQVYESEYPAITGEFRWRHVFDLGPTNPEFFAQGAADQFKKIELFLRQSIQAVSLIERSE